MTVSVPIPAPVQMPIIDDEREEAVEEVLAVDPVPVVEFDLAEVDERDLFELPVEETVEKELILDRIAAGDLSVLVLADLGVNMSDVREPIVKSCGVSSFAEETKKCADAETKSPSKKWSVPCAVSRV
ncbi:hypothetical protein AMAG_04561 [Allomyces macrogynus ATCC 38327]|uniref:Uncharacterized protein n=1 Tax=Allomyces macrogynus (strain ATCC 38327) TaxID=578462 RepID=A0A0L0S5B4_ALLM3|nr:hypothetical protein AMAG_04561 [Allomyces macrogynus ATCC 38327]|eukprot:KNE57702.1 hypothetical protein AMAG_04561 [Allomyces macrogynus ATCC 38327]